MREGTCLTGSSIHPSICSHSASVCSESSAVTQGYLDVSSSISLGPCILEGWLPSPPHVMERGQSPNASLVIFWEIPIRCRICQLFSFCDLGEVVLFLTPSPSSSPKEDPTPLFLRNFHSLTSNSPFPRALPRILTAGPNSRWSSCLWTKDLGCL